MCLNFSFFNYYSCNNNNMRFIRNKISFIIMQLIFIYKIYEKIKSTTIIYSCLTLLDKNFKFILVNKSIFINILVINRSNKQLIYQNKIYFFISFFDIL